MFGRVTVGIVERHDDGNDAGHRRYVPVHQSLSEVREFYVETYMADKPADESERAWKHELQLHFDGIQHVKDMKAQAEDDAKEYWETHPKELQQALEAGLTNEADYKDAILEKEGIKKTAAMRRIRPGRRSR